MDTEQRIKALENALKDIEIKLKRHKQENDRLTKTLSRKLKNPFLSVEVHLADHCNLNCKGCDHFSPIADPGFPKLDIFERDLKRLKVLFSNDLIRLRMLGGEPLLNPDITIFLKIARDVLCDAELEIVTNGLLLTSMNDGFWVACKENNIVIRPTKYPVNCNYEKAKKSAEYHGVRYEYYSNEFEEKTLYHDTLDISGKQNPRMSFLKCYSANRCIFLEDGKLYPCNIIPNIHHFNSMFNKSLNVTHKDYIDIFQASGQDEIMEFLSNPVPFCRYCNIDAVTYNNKWEKSHRAIEEWI